MRRTDALLLLGLLVLPVGIQWGVGDAVIGLESDDLSGHLWTLWNATRGPMTSTELVNAPSGVDLMPIVGGWLDIRLGSWLAPWLGVAGAYNAVLSLYLLLAGVGGFLLARALGARTGGGVLAGCSSSSIPSSCCTWGPVAPNKPAWALWRWPWPALWAHGAPATVGGCCSPASVGPP